MKLSRRGIFGFLAAAPVAVAAKADVAPEQQSGRPFVGQLRTVHSHYVPSPPSRTYSFGAHTHSFGAHTHAVPVAVVHYEQWTGREWVKVV